MPAVFRYARVQCQWSRCRYVCAGWLPNISTSLITPETAIYDMTYNAEVSSFNAWAKENGARLTIDGLGMLVGQAAESFAIWRGVKPGAKQVLTELRHNLAG